MYKPQGNFGPALIGRVTGNRNEYPFMPPSILGRIVKLANPLLKYRLTGNPEVSPAPQTALPELNLRVADQPEAIRPNHVKRLVLLEICKIKGDCSYSTAGLFIRQKRLDEGTRRVRNKIYLPKIW
jgi:hypothetical protein